MRIRFITPLLAVSLLFSSCNIFGSLDSSEDERERKNAAVVKGNEQDCYTSIDILSKVSSPSDDSLAALGWAQLCVAGATASNIASSLLKFSSTSTDLTVVGVLARAMLPMTSLRLGETANAVGTFNNIRDVRIRNLELAIGKIVRASAIIADRAPNGANSGKLEQDDIAAAACAAVDSSCTTAAGNCTAGMSDADVTSVVTLLSEASTNLGTAGAADLKALSDAIVSGLGAGGDTGRCFIYKRLVPST